MDFLFQISAHKTMTLLIRSFFFICCFPLLTGFTGFVVSVIAPVVTHASSTSQDPIQPQSSQSSRVPFFKLHHPPQRSETRKRERNTYTHTQVCNDTAASESTDFQERLFLNWRASWDDTTFVSPYHNWCAVRVFVWYPTGCLSSDDVRASSKAARS